MPSGKKRKGHKMATHKRKKRLRNIQAKFFAGVSQYFLFNHQKYLKSSEQRFNYRCRKDRRRDSFA